MKLEKLDELRREIRKTRRVTSSYILKLEKLVELRRCQVKTCTILKAIKGARRTKIYSK